jgi:hypothetical protein
MTKLSVAELRNEVLAEFSRAKLHGSNDWQGLAERLAALIPQATVRLASGTPALNRGKWADYTGPKWSHPDFESVTVTVMFEDGTVLNSGCTGNKKKPVNWGVAARVAIAFYRNRVTQRAYKQRPHAFYPGYAATYQKFERTVKVPRIVSMTCNGIKCEDIQHVETKTVHLSN